MPSRPLSARPSSPGSSRFYVEHSQQAGCPAVVAQRRQLHELVDAVA
jgi:hypothetical protein